MIYSTKGIVLRTIKYGETSVITSIFTEMFGIQSYIMNGVRSAKKNAKASFFQPSSLLDMQVYHNDLKNLQRIKDVCWSYLYQAILNDIIKNAVALYMVELLYKCLKQPEPNTDLFNFCEDAFLELDKAGADVTANFPLYFTLQLAHFFGLQIQDNFSTERNQFSITGGSFTKLSQANDNLLEPAISGHFSQLLKALQPHDLAEVKLNKHTRKIMLLALEKYYSFHIPEFGVMKTIPILHEIIG